MNKQKERLTNATFELDKHFTLHTQQERGSKVTHDHDNHEESD